MNHGRRKIRLLRNQVTYKKTEIKQQTLLVLVAGAKSSDNAMIDVALPHPI